MMPLGLGLGTKDANGSVRAKGLTLKTSFESIMSGVPHSVSSGLGSEQGWPTSTSPCPDDAAQTELGPEPDSASICSSEIDGNSELSSDTETERQTIRLVHSNASTACFQQTFESLRSLPEHGRGFENPVEEWRRGQALGLPVPLPLVNRQHLRVQGHIPFSLVPQPTSPPLGTTGAQRFLHSRLNNLVELESSQSTGASFSSLFFVQSN
jgi:hypothetical protein